MEEPARNPVVCGALGRYDPEVVRSVAAALGVGLREAHRDRRAVLWLDRKPIRWRSALTRGYAWSERFPPPPAGETRSWEEAATGLDACGLVAGPSRRAIHSSVSGVSPVYWIDHEGATYFASRVDALARGVPGRLDPDWDAWSAIFSLRLPLGERTPFRQIRRLRPFSVLQRDAGAGRVTELEWPWARVELTDDLEAAADDVRAALAEALAPLAATGATVLLSGGLDSRILMGVAHDAGVPLAALTAVADDARGWEAGLAEVAAGAAGADFEALAAADGADYRRLWLDHLEASDFQFLLGSFVMPMGARLAELGRPALDGLGIDVFCVRGGRFYSEEMLNPADGFDAGMPLWRTLHSRTMRKAPERALAEPYARAVMRSSRRQFREEAARFAGLRTQALLTQYTTRMLRGVSTLPHQTMGRHAHVLTPGATDGVARAALRLDPHRKRGRSLYAALFDRIESPSARAPTVADTSEPAEAMPAELRRRFSAPMIDLYAEALRDGPLVPFFGERLAGHVRAGTLAEGIRRTVLHRATMATTVFHLWSERYESVLRPIDPAELLETGE